MNLRQLNPLAIAALAAMTPICGTRYAHAISGHTDVFDIRQVDFSPVVSLGHMVTASTYLPQLAVSGTFRASCPSAYTSPILGQNEQSQTAILQQNVLTVGVPAGWLPAQIEMPGFRNVPSGTTLTCGYYWTGSAKESAYTITLPIGTVIGGGTYNDGSTVTFEMYQPGGDAANGNDCGAH